MNSKPRPVFAPSLMCMDLAHVAEQLALLEGRATLLHVDIMDGHFVRNLSLSPDFIRQIRSHTNATIDAHVMVTDPGFMVEELLASGADCISLHAETLNGEAFRQISKIQRAGRQVGVVLNPETTLDAIEPYLGRLDKVTVMTVAPGFAGEDFIPEMLPKIRRLVERRSELGARYLVEVDGQCNAGTYRDLSQAGPDILIVGTSGLFALDADLNVAWDRMLAQYDAAVA